MNKKSNSSLAFSLIMLIVGMCLLAYASVPLYNLFCKATGYGGTTRQAIKSSTTKGERIIKVRFDANTDSHLPWAFGPQQKEITIKTGENALVFYFAENKSNQPIIGTAIYNVTPYKAGKYFNKIQCFCFTEQLLTANQKMNMPVSFFIDAQFDRDPYMDDVNEITLSYTFFKAKD